jgi:hypothetical protein
MARCLLSEAQRRIRSEIGANHIVTTTALLGEIWRETEEQS